MTRMGRNPFEEKLPRKRVKNESVDATAPISETVNEMLTAKVTARFSANASQGTFQKLQLKFDVEQFAETVFEGKFSQQIKTVAHLLANLKR